MMAELTILRLDFCDFCQCTFPDNVTNRRNHNEGAMHINNRKLHYDWYKDPDVFVQEQANKPPCRHYISYGHCEYGLLCKYSHITYDPASGQPIYPPELLQWFELQQQEAIANSTVPPKPATPTQRYRLPSGWKIKDLPLSLRPPPPKYGYDWSNTGAW
ncbi:CCCH-type zinc finger transcription factor [Mucor lusitanicus]|uniref:CCCH-type zinc finger transcription factor n=1 Tax=Mucor circinelloides f. lusitanicus TaxID=29924 RepID=A0A8H4BBD3_MUCCL|nr:CCCH-type zinc finger transcription factor [Mucor lusitanicus]